MHTKKQNRCIFTLREIAAMSWNLQEPRRRQRPLRADREVPALGTFVDSNDPVNLSVEMLYLSICTATVAVATKPERLWLES